MPPPRRKHPIRKPPPPKPSASTRTSTAPSNAPPSAEAIREANEAAELQNAVMAEQIMKSDAPQAVKNFVTRPDYKVDIRACQFSVFYLCSSTLVGTGKLMQAVW